MIVPKNFHHHAKEAHPFYWASILIGIGFGIYLWLS